MKLISFAKQERIVKSRLWREWELPRTCRGGGGEEVRYYQVETTRAEGDGCLPCHGQKLWEDQTDQNQIRSSRKELGEVLCSHSDLR